MFTHINQKKIKNQQLLQKMQLNQKLILILNKINQVLLKKVLHKAPKTL